MELVKKPSAHLLLNVSLAEDLSADQIAQWLKVNLPAHVIGVDIEALILKAKKLRGLVEPTAFPPGSLLSKLSVSAKSEIIAEIQGLHNTLSAIPSSVVDERTAENALGDLGSCVAAVCDTVETSILLDIPEKHLRQACNDPESSIIGAQEAISLRQHLLNLAAIPDGPFIPREKIIIPRKEARFRYGTISDRAVIVDAFRYIPNPETGEPFQATVTQVRKMAGLLLRTSRPSYHVLPCVGYIHEEIYGSFGFVFEVPLHYKTQLQDSPISLSNLYGSEHKKEKKLKRVTLGNRIHLAHALVIALESFHRVGWVHKQIRSDQIFFLPRPASSTTDLLADRIDWKSPWLFGFEYARAEDDGTLLAEDYTERYNLFRHPDRWGRPRARFRKAHDVYAMVLSPPLWQRAYFPSLWCLELAN